MARPREFEPEEAVTKAMNVFWRKGYTGTSVQDLVEQTGVNRASLYAVFRDKHSLFLRVLARYCRDVVPGRMGILEHPDASLPQIRAYFEAVTGDLACQRDHRGCLMVNSAIELAPRDPEVARRVRAHLGRLERAFASALHRAAARGQIADRRSIPAYARFLVGTAQGLMVVGKASPSSQLLRDIVERTLQALK